MSTAMVRASDVSVALRPQYDDVQMNVLRDSVCRDHSEPEIALFLEYCRVRGFAPFSRMIYSTIRTNNRGVRSQTFQIGIDGMRSQAETNGKYAGQLGPFWCDGDGNWRDIWLSDDPPFAAKVGVLRSDFKEPIWAIAKWTEYKPAEDWMWKKMPSNQLAKCAEALALRKAFPEKLAGVYSEEEMAQAAPKTFLGNTYLPEGPQLPGPCCCCEKDATVADGLALYCEKHKSHAAQPGEGKGPLKASYPASRKGGKVKAEEPRPLPSTDTNYITEPQRKRFYAIYKNLGWADGEVKNLLAGYGIQHGSEIPKSKYEEIVKKIEMGTGPIVDDPEPGSEG